MGTSFGSQVTPSQISGGGTWTFVATGYRHSCAIKTDGTLWCWGRGDNGQRGENATAPSNQTTPVAVSGGGTWKRVAAGNAHSCGIKSDDTLHCWGANSSGQLGDNSTTQRLVPTVTSGGGIWKHVATSSSHTCAITTVGAAYCWGYNTNGQIGDNSTTGRLVPTAVAGGGVWEQTAVTVAQTCAVKSDGALWCWGGVSSPFGVFLADGTSNGSLIPVAASGGGSWTGVTMGTQSSHACVISSNDGSLNCWGSNASGQLTVTEYSTPYSTIGVQALCGSPSGKPGTLLYNADHNVMQYCDGAGWVAISK